MSRAFIQIGSWEDRFVGSFHHAVGGGIAIGQYYCLSSRRYEQRTSENRANVKSIADAAGIPTLFRFCDFGDVVELSSVMRQCVRELRSANVSDVVLDISTCPRHIIWGLLSLIEGNFDRVIVRYAKAVSYGDWQTDEDQDPRLVPNCSGVMYPDRPTCLIMLCGPDVSRAEKMYYKFEPRMAMILRDTDAHKFGRVKAFEYVKSNIDEIIFDNKRIDEDNINSLAQMAGPLLNEFNVVCASFGPKLGSVLLFQLIRRLPDIGLSYVPAGIHNEELSRGTGDILEIKL